MGRANLQTCEPTTGNQLSKQRSALWLYGTVQHNLSAYMPLVPTAVAESQYATTDTKKFQKKRMTYFDCRLFILYLQYKIKDN